MYLTIKQHDAFRTLLMGFEIPFRKYVSDVVISVCHSYEEFELAIQQKKNMLTPSSPEYLKSTLASLSNNTKKLKDIYSRFIAATSSTDDIITSDIEIPVVGMLNMATISFSDSFGDLYTLFGSYGDYCDLAEQYRYARNKLDHPGSRTLEDSHLAPVLSFVKDICIFLDDACFLQKSREQLTLDERKSRTTLSAS